MSIPVVCPGCSAKLNAPDSAAGKKVKCPKCQGAVPVPAPAAEFVDDDEPAPPPKKPAPKPAAKPVAKAAVEPDEEDDAPPKKRAKAVADDDEDEEAQPRKKNKRKQLDDDEEEGGVSMQRNIIMGVVLVILIGVAIFIFVKRSQDSSGSSSNTPGEKEDEKGKGPPVPVRPGPVGPGPRPGPDQGGKTDLYAGIGLPAGTATAEEDAVIDDLATTELFVENPQWFLTIKKDGPEGRQNYHARVFLRPNQHAKIANLWPGQRIKIRGQRTPPRDLAGITVCDFYAAEVVSSGPEPKFVEMTVDQC